MSEYPWDIESMMLAQHEQPCDCAICDDIHSARLTRKNRREAISSELQFWKDETRRAIEAGDKAFVKVMKLYGTMVAENEELKAKLEAQKAKCNIYNCMDRKDLKLRIEQLENMHKEIVKECINIIKDYDKEGDAEATLCGYVFASSVICAIKRKFGVEI